MLILVVSLLINRYEDYNRYIPNKVPKQEFETNCYDML